MEGEREGEMAFCFFRVILRRAVLGKEDMICRSFVLANFCEGMFDLRRRDCGNFVPDAIGDSCEIYLWHRR